MAEELPPPGRLPALLPDDVFDLPTGAIIARIFRAGGAHPVSWNQFRNYGPVATMRFDHHPGPPSDHPVRAIMYAGGRLRSDGQTQDPLAPAVIESFADAHTVDLTTGDLRLTVWSTERPLRLLDVVDGPWITRAGGNAAVSTGRRDRSRDWSRAIYTRYRDVDGLYYLTSNAPSLRSVALFERATAALPAQPLVDMALDDPVLDPALRRIAGRFGYGFVR